jgi:hypothetical protein
MKKGGGHVEFYVTACLDINTLECDLLLQAKLFYLIKNAADFLDALEYFSIFKD